MLMVACPTLTPLQSLALGYLSDDHIDAIEEHLKTCDDCQSELARYDRLTDPLIDLIREHACPGPVPLNPPLQARLRLAEAIGPQVWREMGRATVQQALPCAQ